jgi:hypothetical protein
MKKESTVFWWIGWIVLTIASFFVACFFWTDFIAKHVGPVEKPGVSILWVSLVFGSWMIALVPLIVIMYRKVDKAYEDARIARENASFEKAKLESQPKRLFVEENKRCLGMDLVRKLKKIPEAIPRGHLVTVLLRDGRSVENVFILDRRELLGIYGARESSFEASDVIDLKPADLNRLPVFKTEEWLRLDG